jgi:hypothetical protein
MKIFLSLALLSTAAFAGDDCSPVDPNPGTRPTYCLNGSSCYVTGAGAQFELHHCCAYDSFLEEMICGDRTPNAPDQSHRWWGCNRRLCIYSDKGDRK